MTPHNFIAYSRQIDEKEGTRLYAWCVFLDGKREEMDSIKHIEYTLHPSFPNPIRVIDDKEHCFALHSQGWGAFQIRVRITYRDGSVGRQGYPLGLAEDAWPR